MQRASLDGLPGACELRSRRRGDASREYRGAFAFRREHEARIVELVASRERVVFEGIVEGERRCMKVIVTDLERTVGLAYFHAVGEPYEVAGDTGRTG